MDEGDFCRKPWTICTIPLKEEIAPSIFNNFLTLEKRLVIFPHLKYLASSSFSSLEILKRQIRHWTNLDPMFLASPSFSPLERFGRDRPG